MARILCVEDEPEIRADLAEDLRDLGHTVASAVNGKEGLEMIGVFRPEIIVCDCLMPVMTGIEMYSALRESNPEFDSIPFVFLSAHAEKNHKEFGLQAGADAYLTKPIDFNVLEELIKRLLTKAAGKIGGLELMGNSND
jgi:CheY-like chemotaxis protein